MIYDSGNNMVSEKGPYERFEGPHCPKCQSTQIIDTRECEACQITTDRLRCPTCNEKTNPVMTCHECCHVWEEK